MVRFTKMEGAGNDYIYVSNLVERVPEERLPALAVAISDRHFGVGADGLIVILPPTEPGHDFRFRMFNADGSEGEMCGNGMRCFARYCYERGLTRASIMRVQTLSGTVVAEVQQDAAGRVAGVRVDMGAPRLSRAEIPVAGPPDRQAVDEELVVGGRAFRVTCVNTGVPHAVVFVDDVDAVDLAAVGPQIETHPAFPRRTNVNFVQVLGEAELKMRTWERGSGITLACGTGASAALVAGHLADLAGRRALVHQPGGDLQVEWDAATGHVFMSGPATFVCDGEFLKDY